MKPVELAYSILTVLVSAWLILGVVLLLLYPPAARAEVNWAILAGKAAFAATFLIILALATVGWTSRLEYFGLSVWRFGLAIALGIFGLMLFVLEEALIMADPVVAVSDTGSINVGMAAALWEITVPAASQEPTRLRRISLSRLAAISMIAAAGLVVGGFALAWASGWDPAPQPVSPWLAAEVGSHFLALSIGVHAWAVLLDRGPEIAAENPAVRLMVPGVSLLGFALVGSCVGDMYPLPPVPYVLVVIAPAWIGGLSYALTLVVMTRLPRRETYLSMGRGIHLPCVLATDLSKDPWKVIRRFVEDARMLGLAVLALAPPGPVAEMLEREVDLLVETGVGLVGGRRSTGRRLAVELDAGLVAGLMGRFRRSTGSRIFLLVWSLNDLVAGLGEAGAYRFVRRLLEELGPEETAVFLADRSTLDKRFSKIIASILVECPGYMRS